MLDVLLHHWHLCCLHHLVPPWFQIALSLQMQMQFQRLIGYRPELHSYSLCLNSVLRVHNETANIWTHLLGSVLFAALIAIYFSLR